MEIRETLEALISGVMIALFAKPAIADEIYVDPEENARYAYIQRKRKHNKQTVSKGVKANKISASFVDLVLGDDDGHTDLDEVRKFLELIGNDETFYAIVYGPVERASAHPKWNYTNNPMDYEYLKGLGSVFTKKADIEKRIKKLERQNPKYKERLHFVQLTNPGSGVTKEPIRVVSYFKRDLGKTIAGIKFPDFSERPVLGYDLRPEMAKQKEKKKPVPKQEKPKVSKKEEKPTPAVSKKPEEKAGKEEVQETVPRDDLLDLFEDFPEKETKPKEEKVIIELKNWVAFGYTLEDLKGKDVYDTNNRRVIAKDGGLWVHGKNPIGLDFYHKYEIFEFKGEKFLSMTLGRLRKDAERIGIAQEFDRLEGRLETKPKEKEDDILELFDEEPTQTPQKDPFIGKEGYFTIEHKGRKIAIPDKKKVMEIAGLKDISGVEIRPEIGFEYGGTTNMLAKLNAVYDIRHDGVKVAQDGDVYIVRPKVGGSALYIKIGGNVAYDPKEIGFVSGTTEELNALAREAELIGGGTVDKVLTGREMCKLIYDTFQAWKARHPRIEQVKPEEHRTDYFSPKGMEVLEKELDEVIFDE